MKTFEQVATAVEGIPDMTRFQGERVYNHLRFTCAKDVLELGTAHGVSACYMACAVQGIGSVTTVDHVDATKFRDPQPADVIARAGLSDTINRVLVDDSSYTWWLKAQIEKNSDEQGNCTPLYDFCYLDGAHNFTIDGLAVVLVERLLRPGGWLLLDDLQWVYEGHPAAPKQDARALMLSRSEETQPHMRAVFELIVRTHPSFSTARIENDNWGWAKKDPGAVKSLQYVATTATLRTHLLLAARKVRSKLRPAGESDSGPSEEK